MRDSRDLNDQIRKPNWLTFGLALALTISLVGNFIQLQNSGQVRNCDHMAREFRRQKREMSGAGAVEYEVGMPPAPTDHSDQPYFLPLYTRLTDSQLTKMCEAKYRKGISEYSKRKPFEYGVSKYKDDARKSAYDRYHYQLVSQPSVRPLKICQPILSLLATVSIGERVHRLGSALRKGDHWLLTEFATGNILFQFDHSHAGDSELDANDEDSTTVLYEFQRLADRRRSTAAPANAPLRFPSRIHTLSESFHGTDHAVDEVTDEGLIFYYIGTGRLVRLQAVHLRNGRQISLLIDAANEPLYKHETDNPPDGLSTVDLEADDGVLWALFRTPNDTALTVVKLAPNSLKELARYRLTLVQPRQVANAFVACGILHTVEILGAGSFTHRTNDNYGSDDESENQSNRSLPIVLGNYSRRHWRQMRRRNVATSRTFVVRSVFDFHAERYLKPLRTLAIDWPYDNNLSSVQYDTVSDSLTVFSNGKIVSIPLKRGVKPP